MGAGCIHKREKAIIAQNDSCILDYSAPDNKKAIIGEYLLVISSRNESTALETWKWLLRDYKSSSPIEEILKDPKRCMELPVHIRQGIPMKWRWQVWNSYIHLTTITEKDYNSIPLNDNLAEHDIKKDINRTFPELTYFDREKYGFYGQFALMRVLGKFATAYPDIGYCQGMNFVVGLLLLVSGGNEAETFCMLEAIICHFKIREFYTENMPELKKTLTEFDNHFQSSLKQLYFHFRENEIFEDMWVLKWFITLFSTVLPLRIVLNVWDIIMVDGILTLIHTALAILKYFEKDLLEKDSIGILMFLNNLKNLEIDSVQMLQPVMAKRSRPKSISKIAPFNPPTVSGEYSAMSKHFSAASGEFSAMDRGMSASCVEFTNSQLDDEKQEQESPFRGTMQCEIREDPNEMPMPRTQSITSKGMKKVKYRNSLMTEDINDTSTMVEESKEEENFDAYVILSDLVTEDFEYS